MMENPTQTVFCRFPASFKADNLLKIFIVTREQQISRLIAYPLNLFQAKLGSKAFALKTIRIVKNVPIRRLPILIGKLVSSQNTLHPPPLGLADVQHNSAERIGA